MDAGIGIGGLGVEKDEFVDSKFDLFGKTDYEVGIKKTISQTFRPQSTTTSKGPFSFLIPSDPDKFTNVESLRLHGKMRIMKKDTGTGALSNIKKNPFNFKDFDISEASLVVNGVHEPPELYKMNKADNDKVDMYAVF